MLGNNVISGSSISDDPLFPPFYRKTRSGIGTKVGSRQIINWCVFFWIFHSIMIGE